MRPRGPLPAASGLAPGSVFVKVGLSYSVFLHLQVFVFGSISSCHLFVFDHLCTAHYVYFRLFSREPLLKGAIKNFSDLNLGSESFGGGGFWAPEAAAFSRPRIVLSERLKSFSFCAQFAEIYNSRIAVGKNSNESNTTKTVMIKVNRQKQREPTVGCPLTPPPSW